MIRLMGWRCRRRGRVVVSEQWKRRNGDGASASRRIGGRAKAEAPLVRERDGRAGWLVAIQERKIVIGLVPPTHELESEPGACSDSLIQSGYGLPNLYTTLHVCYMIHMHPTQDLSVHPI